MGNDAATGRGGREVIAIDLLRFACAALVVLHHYGISSARAPSLVTRAMLRQYPLGTGWRWAWPGWVGVELFFVISSYVIAISAEGSTIGPFVRRRVLRLLPAIWICATLTLALVWPQHVRADVVAAWLRSVLFEPYGQQIDAVYWTLPIEAAFYGWVAVALWRGGGAERLRRLALAIGSASTLFWIGCVAAQRWPITPLANHLPIQWLMLPHGCLFALGMLARASERDGWRIRTLAAGAAFAGAATLEIVAHATMRLDELHLPPGTSLASPLLLFAGGLAVVFAGRRTQPAAARLVRPRVAATLGLMTYPLYLIHQDAGAVVTAWLMRAGLPFAAAAGLTALAALATAWLIARWAEPQVRRASAAVLDRLVSPRRDPAPGNPRIASPPAG